jgi:hypothetical protein
MAAIVFLNAIVSQLMKWSLNWYVITVLTAFICILPTSSRISRRFIFYYNLILRAFSLRFSWLKCCINFLFPVAYYISWPSHFHWFDPTNNINPATTRKFLRWGDCSDAVQGECILPGGLEGDCWWEVWRAIDTTTQTENIKQLRVACSECAFSVIWKYSRLYHRRFRNVECT